VTDDDDDDDENAYKRRKGFIYKIRARYFNVKLQT
jgi:hypothetical protein